MFCGDSYFEPRNWTKQKQNKSNLKQKVNDTGNMLLTSNELNAETKKASFIGKRETNLNKRNQSTAEKKMID